MNSFSKIFWPSFDPVSLLARLRERNPGGPLIHIDRERSTGWSYVPVRIESVLEDWGGRSLVWRDGRPDPSPSKRTWETHPLLSQPLSERPEGPVSSDGTGSDVPPFCAGLVLLLPFEMGELWEPSGGPFAAPSVPAILCECPEVVAFHAPTGRLFLPYGFDRSLLEPVIFKAPDPLVLSPSHDQSDFSALMHPIRKALEGGDYFQLNISIRFGANWPEALDPLAVYSRMRRPVTPFFGGYFSFGGRFVLSHSPEQLLAVSGTTLRTFPIAGTAEGDIPGPSDPLRHDPKILAEHIMIVDLLRNDIGRVSLPGSVRVPRLMAIESYPHLRHLVSEVAGEVDGRSSRADVIRSLFPGGSVTGTPKIRVRRHTQLLEREPRNYYCGSLGFVSESGAMDLSLLIRTLEGRRKRVSPIGREEDDGLEGEGELTLRVGAGIVSDSDPESEYREILVKAQAFREILTS